MYCYPRPSVARGSATEIFENPRGQCGTDDPMILFEPNYYFLNFRGNSSASVFISCRTVTGFLDYIW